MILTQTPFRIPLGGGGTDLPEFYTKYGGFCWGATIDKYVYVMKKGDEVVSVSDFAKGTGMGGSASYRVGRLLCDYPAVGPKFLAQHVVEKGKQDQWITAFGGFISLEINKRGAVKGKRLKFKPEIIEELNSKLQLRWTGFTHQTEKQQKKGLNLNGMLKIKEIGLTMLSEMKGGSVKNFGKLMDEHWKIKRQMNGMSSPELDKIYQEGLDDGAEGGKLLGSGGGGYFLFYGLETNFNFINQGAQILWRC